MARSRRSLATFMRAVVGARPWEADSRVVERPWDESSVREESRCFGIMRWDGLVRCHPPIERGLDEVANKLRAAGHEGPFHRNFFQTGPDLLANQSLSGMLWITQRLKRS